MMSNINFPSTRFLGSKLKLLPWIYDNIKDIDFNIALDGFGGTASVSYLMKSMDKKVYYNDILNFNQNIAVAIIENSAVKVQKDEITKVLKLYNKQYKKVIQTNFKGIYFKDSENKWLDNVVQNILTLDNKYKKALLFSALFQACLIKRPFNLFHRNNLNLRINDKVNRKFGNKKTWDTPFKKHFLKFIEEYNKSVFDNKEKNEVLGGYDILEVPKKRYDLVYLDPSYLSKKSKVNYLDCYHFLEGISDYNHWEKRIDLRFKTKKLQPCPILEKWLDKEKIESLFRKMIRRYKKSSIVLSYRNDGIPSKKKISDIFHDIFGKPPVIKEKQYKYALSNGSTKELLFISVR